MTPEALSRLHTTAFAPERGWSASEFSVLLAQPYTTLFTEENGFALTRTLAGESELLTLAVHPAHQSKGIGSALLDRWLSGTNASKAFLEVAADNAAAIALYTRAGFQETGRRQAYYRRPDAPFADAIVMSRSMT